MTTNGPIKRITEKGFGFVATAEGTEYFFRQSACAGAPFDQLREGQTVSFTVGQGPKGPGPRTSTCGDRSLFAPRREAHRSDASVTPAART